MRYYSDLNFKQTFSSPLGAVNVNAGKSGLTGLQSILRQLCSSTCNATVPKNSLLSKTNKPPNIVNAIIIVISSRFYLHTKLVKHQSASKMCVVKPSNLKAVRYHCTSRIYITFSRLVAFACISVSLTPFALFKL